MARRLGPPALFVILTLSGAGCSRLGTHDSGAPDAGAPSTDNSTSTQWASNAGEVARFADEVPFGPEATIANDKTRVRQSPGGGEVIATLSAGTDVTKLSAHGSDALVCFDEPNEHGRHLVGWVAQSALQDATPPPPPPDAVEDAGPPPPDPPPRPQGHHHHHGKKPQRH